MDAHASVVGGATGNCSRCLGREWRLTASVWSRAEETLAVNYTPGAVLAFYRA